jgi:hypothetical protein
MKKFNVLMRDDDDVIPPDTGEEAGEQGGEEATRAGYFM